MSDSDKPDNVLEFPGRKPEQPAQSSVTTFEIHCDQTPANTVPRYSLRHQMFHDTNAALAASYTREQRAQLWEIWDLCYQIQKTSLYAAQVPPLAESILIVLQSLVDQLPKPPGESDGPEQN